MIPQTTQVLQCNCNRGTHYSPLQMVLEMVHGLQAVIKIFLVKTGGIAVSR